MWIKESPEELTKELYNGIYNSSYKLNFLYKGTNVYIMDNHLAAGFCWLKELSPEEEYNFLHIDKHTDLLSAGKKNAQQILEVKDMSLENYLGLRRQNPDLPLFSWDNYIYNIFDVYPNWFKKNIFCCHEFVEEKRPIGTSLQIDGNINLNGFPDIITNERKWIVNIDIDYFWNDNDEGEYSLYLTEEVFEKFIDNLFLTLDNIVVITIALSPVACGGWRNAYNITQKFSDKFNLDFELNIRE